MSYQGGGGAAAGGYYSGYSGAAGAYGYGQQQQQQQGHSTAAATGADAYYGAAVTAPSYGGGYSTNEQYQRQEQQQQQQQPAGYGGSYGQQGQGYGAYTDPNAAAAGAAGGYNGSYGYNNNNPQQQQAQQTQQYGQQYGQAYGAEANSSNYNQYPDPNQAQPYQQQQQQQQQPQGLQPSEELAALNGVDDNGLRWTWSTFPTMVRKKGKAASAAAATIPVPDSVVPLSCMYLPLHPLSLDHLVQDDPQAAPPNTGVQVCTNCGAFWSRHSPREVRQGGGPGGAGFWVCMSCQRKNPLPVNFSEQHPAMQHDTVEYIIPDGPAQVGLEDDLRRPAFLFVVDTCLPHEEVTALKASLQDSLRWLPPRSLVGVIAFGARTTVWELCNASQQLHGSSPSIMKCYAFRGDAEYTPEDMPRMLQVSNDRPVRGRFLCPLEECSETLSTLIAELECDPAPQRSNRRPLRTTGTAVSIATFLLESLRQNSASPGKTAAAAAANGGAPQQQQQQQQQRGGAAAGRPAKTFGRILLFTGGPCTRGVGMTVGTDKGEMMRFHRDIIEGNTPYYEKAHQLYNQLDVRLSAVDGCLDVFAQSFDQVGVMEMRNCVNNTGGTFVCGDCFAHENFTKSFERYFERCDLRVRDGAAADAHDGGSSSSSYAARCAFGVHIEAHTSPDTLVSGVLGPCNVDEEANRTKPPRANASAVELGVGGTTRWCISTLDQGVALAFVFDTATLDDNSGDKAAPQQQQQQQKNRFIQFVVRYMTPNGQQRIRVTSVAQPVAPASARPDYYVTHKAFDQTCASTIIARLVVSFLEQFPHRWDDAKRWVDTQLVRFIRRYGQFTPGLPDSLTLDPCLSLFPSFMFNLRRSEFFLVLNISPDETTFKRHWLMREGVDNSVLMIQPTLDSYDIEYPYATAVPLDSSSLRHDNIVLMDAFFNVHILWGNTIFEWIEAKYHELPDYAHFADLLNTAEADAQAILAARYPYPRFSRTSANGSEARHVKTRVNPATTHHQQQPPIPGVPGGQQQQPAGEVIYTDDASIARFMASLKQAVVAPEEGSDASRMARR